MRIDTKCDMVRHGYRGYDECFGKSEGRNRRQDQRCGNSLV